MRIVSFIFILMSFFSIGIASFVYADADTCDATDMGNASNFLKECGRDTGGYLPNIGGGVESTKEYVISIATKVIEFGALFAIGAIVFSGVQYAMSYGDDEKIKKAKMTGIYAVGWLLLLLTAFSLVDILVNFIYNLS